MAMHAALPSPRVRPSRESRNVWSVLSLRNRFTTVLTAITMQSPAKMLEMKWKTGMKGEYQSGWTLPGAMRNRAPRADWWSVDRITPAIVMPIVIMSAHFRVRRALIHSRIAGLNSSNWTVRYVATCHATRKSTDVGPYETAIG